MTTWVLIIVLGGYNISQQIFINNRDACTKAMQAINKQQERKDSFCINKTTGEVIVEE